MADRDVPPYHHERLLSWVEEVAALTQPDAIHWCDGSAEEYDRLCQELVDAGTFPRLSDAKRPNSYLALSDPGDVARVEDRTFICSEREEDAGPTNNWREPEEMRAIAARSCSRARWRAARCTSCRSRWARSARRSPQIGVQLTDSAYVAVSMRIMTRMGRGALDVLGEDGDFVPCLHSVGAPLAEGEKSVGLAVQRGEQYIVHFPETREIWSYGSGYGGNALLGKKCFALRIASVMARDEGWMAEHMLILKLTSPEGEVKYLTGAFPSACGKTNLAMLIPSLEGWKVETIGDDIAWMKFGDDGRLYAVNPEAGLLRRGAGHGRRDQPERDGDGPGEHDLHQLRADRRRRRLVGGHDAEPPAHATDWKGNDWTPESETPAAHPNARFTVPAAQTRRSRRSGRTRPACRSTRSCSAGAARPSCRSCARRSTGSTASSSARPWAPRRPRRRPATVGELRLDPMAMLPFCGYNMGDYFGHWLEQGRREGAELPRIFFVNWFRKDPETGQVPVAGLRRELARARVDLPPLRGRGRGGRDADRPRADGRRAGHRRARHRARGRSRSSCTSTPTSGSRRSSRSASSTPSSATSSRPSSRGSSTRSRSASKSS